MPQQGDEYLAVLKASYDYEPQSEDEVAIKESHIVFLLEKTDDDWWRVKIKGDSQDEDSPSGLVPAAYVENADHISVAKALYDYDAAAAGELTIKEDEMLIVFDREDEWVLVQSQKEGGKAGFVPGNYIVETSGEVQIHEPEPELEPPRPQIVPPSPRPPARPVSVYVDPADRVAQTPVKAPADNIKTWAVSEVDNKGKKKKGTLGIGNGSIFFASESDKTPVQKWNTADVQDFTIERHKHILIDMGGSNPTKLHFNVGKEEIAETILTKLDDSRKLAISNASEAASTALHNRRSTHTPPPHPMESGSPSKKNGVSVRFTEKSPEIIPPREPSEDDEGEEDGTGITGNEQEGEPGAALYDFEGTGPDELSVQEGERLFIIEKEGEEWWKCRNAGGDEGVVPASYLESLGSSTSKKVGDEDERARKERERDVAEKEPGDKERKKIGQEHTKVTAAQRKLQEKEQVAAAAEALKKQQETTKRVPQKAQSELGTSSRSRTSVSNPSRDSSSARTSNEYKSAPPPESTRIWHDRSGQFRVEAALLGYTNGKLRLHKINGVVIEVPSEKMSLEDMKYVKRLLARKRSNSPGRAVSPRATNDDDDKPLALKRPSEATRRTPTLPQKKGPQVDWFDFFLSAGCDLDDCTRYAHSFERDKIDESLLPDITESTMRSLGLREGDIIRVNKVIQQKYVKPQASPPDHQTSDEALAMRLQEEENAKKTVSSAPNLFAGPGGVLKNNTQRRGRPQPKSTPPVAVDLGAIGNASEQIKRSGSPMVRTSSPSPVQPPQRSSSAMATVSGFDDDAWTNRPGSKPPASNPTLPATAVSQKSPSIPPAAQAAATPPPASPAPPQANTTTGPSSLAKTTEADVFDQLTRLSELKTHRVASPLSPIPPSASSPHVTSPLVVSPPSSYNNGLGMRSFPVPMGQNFQNQHPSVLPLSQQNEPRGPYAPIPANQGLLQPLVPTQTGFTTFVPTRPSNTSPFQPQPQPAQPSFLQTQITGFPGNSQTIFSQPAGFSQSGPILAHPTGASGGPLASFASPSPFSHTAAAPVLTNPTGFSPFGQAASNNSISAPSPAPSGNSSNTSPASVFAQMKSGTFASGNEYAAPQHADKYDALRVNSQPTGWVPQSTGWGIHRSSGF